MVNEPYWNDDRTIDWMSRIPDDAGWPKGDMEQSDCGWACGWTRCFKRNRQRDAEGHTKNRRRISQSDRRMSVLVSQVDDENRNYATRRRPEPGRFDSVVSLQLPTDTTRRQSVDELPDTNLPRSATPSREDARSPSSKTLTLPESEEKEVSGGGRRSSHSSIRSRTSVLAKSPAWEDTDHQAGDSEDEPVLPSAVDTTTPRGRSVADMVFTDDGEDDEANTDVDVFNQVS
jgi:hypothetical protein